MMGPYAPGPYGPGGPPMMPMLPPQPPRQHSFARAIFMTLATSIFGLSLALNVYLLLISGLLGGGSSAVQSTIVAGDSDQKIAVIPITGLIAGEMSQRIDRHLRAIERDKDVKAIVLAIDSPGGTVTASDEIYHRLTSFQTDMSVKGRSIPIVATMGSLAASGGYYVACAADYIYAQPTTLTGNIGVLFPRYNASKLAEEWGIQETTLESRGAPFKNAGSWLRPEEPEETAYFQSLIDQAFVRFKQVVDEGRRTNNTTRLTRPLDEIANGKIYTQAEAQALGLVDKGGYAIDAYKHAASMAGLSKPHVVRYADPPSALEILLGRSSTPDPAALLDGAGLRVKVDPAVIHELTTPRMMYLWRGQ
jgi:protease-4